MTKDLKLAAAARLEEGASKIGVSISPAQTDLLIAYLFQMLEWNEKINLTAVTDPLAAVEHHLVDALAAASSAADLNSVMDIGTGGGVPGIPLAILNPGQKWVLVETLKKKVGFLKSAAAALGLKNVQSIQARACGHPSAEGIPLCEGAISRAFTAAPEWIDLAQHYVCGKRAVLFMLGVGTDAKAFAETASDKIISSTIVNYQLPFEGIPRQVLRLELK